MKFEKVIEHFSVRGLHVEDVRRYFDAGGDADHRDTGMGWTLLHFAAEDCNAEVIRLVAGRGADLNAKDLNGWTPLHLAVDSDLDTSAQGGRRSADLPTVRTLVELGADGLVRTGDGLMPRDIAANYGEGALYDTVFMQQRNLLQ